MKTLKSLLAAVARTAVWSIKRVWHGEEASSQWIREKVSHLREWVEETGFNDASAALSRSRGVGPQTAAALNAAADQARSATRNPDPMDAEAAKPPHPGRVIRSIAGNLVNRREVPERLLEALKPEHFDWISRLGREELERLSQLEPGRILALLRGDTRYGVPNPAEAEAREQGHLQIAAIAESAMGRRVAGHRAGRNFQEFGIETVAADTET